MMSFKSKYDLLNVSNIVKAGYRGIFQWEFFSNSYGAYVWCVFVCVYCQYKNKRDVCKVYNCYKKGIHKVKASD